jgi:hypothetical protein
MHDESLEPRAYARLHADRYLWQEQQERSAFWQEMAISLEREARERALTELTAQAQELGMGY